MYGKTFSYAISGIDAIKIEVEADIKGGLYKFSIVGLPSNSVKESRDRISAAIKNSGFKFPSHNYTVNLAPADTKKDGVALDLPTAVALLKASNQFDIENSNDYALVGELSLQGDVRGVKGILPIAIAAKQDNLKGIILASENAKEAAVVEGLNVYPVNSLRETIEFLSGIKYIEPTKVDPEELFAEAESELFDMFDVKGQMHVKRALEVAAAGGHNVLMIGPPGSGKTMLARRLPSILPTLTIDEALEATKVHSVSGMLNSSGILKNRPFRSPHHTISDVALIGGGSYPKPGEVSLAHNGVLFLDEMPEFGKSVLEVLRQPLEDGIVNISRASQSLQFPAKFILIASMNPCPCGYYGSDIKGHSCSCSMHQISRYRSKISGPLLDRIDIHLEVQGIDYDELSSIPSGEKSDVIRKRVNHARKIQLNRLSKDKIFSNSQLSSKHIRKYCELSKSAAQLLKAAMNRLGLSARAYDRILKVSRTIADLEQEHEISPKHIGEAIQYRSLDRKFFS